jgi:hypothetical protein
MEFHTKPATGWTNIFELWRENGERLPFEVVKSTWSPRAGHYLIVEKVEIKKWPYGTAWGHYHWNGRSAERGQIKAAGTYNWKRRPGDQPPVATQYSGT